MKTIFWTPLGNMVQHSFQQKIEPTEAKKICQPYHLAADSWYNIGINKMQNEVTVTVIRILFICHGRIYRTWKNACKSSTSCVSTSVLPMIYQCFWRARLANYHTRMRRSTTWKNSKNIFTMNTMACIIRWLATTTSPTWDCRKKPGLLEFGADAQRLFRAVLSSPV